MIGVDPEVLDGVLELLNELSGDWEQQYGRLPFAEYLEELGQRPVEDRDITVAELVAFVCKHRQPSLEEV